MQADVLDREVAVAGEAAAAGPASRKRGALGLPNADPADGYIRGFHALRAIAVLLVIASHVGIMELSTNRAWVAFFSIFNATYGVKTFFVLSGFLITTLLMREWDLTGHINIPRFMARRALRILPLYFLVLALASLLILMKIAEPAWNAILMCLFYVYNFRHKWDVVNYAEHFWSLAVEEQFYLMWPFLFAALARSRTALTGAAFAVLALCWWRTDNWGPEWSLYRPVWWTIPAIYPIMIGCIAALNIKQLHAALRTIWALIAAYVLILSPLVVPYSAAWEIISTFGIAGIIAWIYLNQGSGFVAGLEWRPLVYIGTISYGLYVWQGFLTGNGTYRSVPSFPPYYIVGALLTFPVADWSYRRFEKPISDLRRYFRPV